MNRPVFDVGFMVESLAESTVNRFIWAVGWILDWLFTAGLWFLGGRFIVETFMADHGIIRQNASRPDRLAGRRCG